jgi:hypothetical protein
MPKKKIPPCPDPERYIFVTTKEGGYWRLKRGSVKPASLNAVFGKNASSRKLTSPAAKRILGMLKLFLQGLRPGRIIARLSSGLSKALNDNGHIHFSFLDGFEWQVDYPLNKLLLDSIRVYQTNDNLEIRVLVGEDYVAKHNNLVTDYYLDAILLYGNTAIDGGLRIDSVESPLYSFKHTANTECILSLPLPANTQPWMLLLKASCLEGNELAVHYKHYGMRVVKTGR